MLSETKSAFGGKSPKFGVVVFPGSNCDHDTYYVLKKIFDLDVIFLWHKQATLENCDANYSSRRIFLW